MNDGKRKLDVRVVPHIHMLQNEDNLYSVQSVNHFPFNKLQKSVLPATDTVT